MKNAEFALVPDAWKAQAARIRSASGVVKAKEKKIDYISLRLAIATTSI